MLVNDFNNEVPDNLEDLIKLPGVVAANASGVGKSLYKGGVMIFTRLSVHCAAAVSVIGFLILLVCSSIYMISVLRKEED